MNRRLFDALVKISTNNKVVFYSELNQKYSALTHKHV